MDSPGAERRGGANVREEILLGIVDHAVALQTDGPVTSSSNPDYLLNLPILVKCHSRESSKLLLNCHNQTFYWQITMSSNSNNNSSHFPSRSLLRYSMRRNILQFVILILRTPRVVVRNSVENNQKNYLETQKFQLHNK